LWDLISHENKNQQHTKNITSDKGTSFHFRIRKAVLMLFLNGLLDVPYDIIISTNYALKYTLTNSLTVFLKPNEHSTQINKHKILAGEKIWWVWQIVVNSPKVLSTKYRIVGKFGGEKVWQIYSFRTFVKKSLANE